MCDVCYIARGKKPTSAEIALVQEIVGEWSREKGRMLTQNETECLVSAIFSGLNNVDYFDGILFGYKLREEHNFTEIQNVLNAMQELINGMIASQKDIMAATTKLLEGIQTPQIQEGDTTDMFSAAIGKPKSYITKALKVADTGDLIARFLSATGFNAEFVRENRGSVWKRLVEFKNTEYVKISEGSSSK